MVLGRSDQPKTTTTTYLEDEPSLHDALQSDEENIWREAVDNEISASKNLRFWNELNRLQGKNVLHSKFVLKKKRNGDGSVAKHKAGLVLFGNEDTDN